MQETLDNILSYIDMPTGTGIQQHYEGKNTQRPTRKQHQ